MIAHRLVAACVLVLFLNVLGANLAAQRVDVQTSFVIDPDRPYVYLKFDHIGPGIPRNRRESKSRIWLRLTNNCRVAITVHENGTPDGSPNDEREIMYNVVPTIKPQMVTFGFKAHENNLKQKQLEEPPSDDLEEMPQGTTSDVGSSEDIPPGESILFSVPVNHLSNRWHIEIPYSFALPPGKCCRKPDIGGQPVMVMYYGLWDLPQESLSEIKQE